MRDRRIGRLGLFALGATAMAVSYVAGHARASGVPQVNPLVYAGVLADTSGVPVPGTTSMMIGVDLWDSPALGMGTQKCTTAAAATTLTNGRFQIVLDPSCTAQVHATPDLYVQVNVAGTALPRTKLGAVPYALEADTATHAAPQSPLASGLVPAGTVVPFAATCDNTKLGQAGGPPTGWLCCDGSAQSRTTYATLLATTGIVWGGGDGLTTFNLPDLRGRFLRGADNGSGNDPGAATRTPIASGPANGVASLESFATALPGTPFETDTQGNHSHDVPPVGGYGSGPTNDGLFRADGNSPANLWYPPPTAVAGNHSHTVTSGGDVETRPANVSVNYIIKY